MRIAYVALYQGPSLSERRPSVLNGSLSRQIKIELVAQSLRRNSHEVEIISQGEVGGYRYKFYPSFSESELFHPGIPVYYASALPIRRLSGLWSNLQTLRLFKSRHRASPYDLVIIWNLKGPQVECAEYAIRRLGVPVILGYEDDVFVDRFGVRLGGGFMSGYHVRKCRRLLKAVSGGMGVSPHLLSQMPDDIPKMLLRGAVGDDIATAGRQAVGAKKNWVLFAGTHVRTAGVEELIEAWQSVKIPGWELHVTGHGELTDHLRSRAEGVEGVRFHGLVSRPELVRLMSSAKICINPHALSQTPGSLFAFKIIEYLAAGASVVTTPMGPLEQQLEAGITYMPDNTPETIAATLHRVIRDQQHERTAMEAAQEMYGRTAVAKALDGLIQEIGRRREAQTESHRGLNRRSA